MHYPCFFSKSWDGVITHYYAVGRSKKSLTHGLILCFKYERYECLMQEYVKQIENGERGSSSNRMLCNREFIHGDKFTPNKSYYSTVCAVTNTKA